MRRDGYFHTGQALIHRRYGNFKGFIAKRIKAAYRSSDLMPGYGVAVVMKPSQADLDFCMPVWFPSEDEIEAIREAMDRSDELTSRILNVKWRGKRPLVRVEVTHQAMDHIIACKLRSFTTELRCFLRRVNAERAYIGRRGEALQISVVWNCRGRSKFEV